MKFILCLATLLNTFCCFAYAETLTVGLEPFPPFINEQGHGYSVDMFKEIEKISDLTFDIKIMTYARAKHELKSNRLDIAGHTPKGLETKSFYHYGVELDWQIATTSDLFSFDKRYFDIAQIKSQRIGTTTGNAGFLAEQLGIAEYLFIEVATLNQLVEMFIKRRIDVLLFERSSIMTLLQEKKAQNVYYQTIGLVPASIAVSLDKKGLKLKRKLDGLIKQLDHQKIFSGYFKYADLPEKGKVPLVQ